MKYFLAVFLLLSFMISAVNATEYSVGVAPPFIDLGSVKAGTSQVVKFYMVTVSPDPMTVDVQSDDVSMDFFKRADYKVYASNYSEQSVRNWVSFFSNPIDLLPSDNAGYGIRGAREIDFILNIPRNAEPGYHVVLVKPSPVIKQENVNGAGIAAITALSVIFNVDGTPARTGRVVDVVYANGNLETYFKNTGTVSINAKAFNTISNSAYSSDVSSSTDMVKPGELHKFVVPAPTAGSYNVSTAVKFTTGEAGFDSTLVVRPATTARAVSAPAEIPWWPVAVLLLIVIAIVIYRRKKR